MAKKMNLNKYNTGFLSGKENIKMSDLKNFVNNILQISNPILTNVIVKESRFLHTKKGERIQNIGDANKNLYFLESGIVRGFFYDMRGHEITDCFVTAAGMPVVSCLDFDIPAPVCFEALDDSTLLSVPFRIIQPYLNTDVEVLCLYNRLLRNSLQSHWENKVMLAQHTAAERYQWFLKRFPGMIDRVNHKYIASYLGVTPVQLSRIRRSIREEQERNKKIMSENQA